MKFYRVLGGPNLGPITAGSGPVTNTVLAGAMSQAVVAVPASAISASNAPDFRHRAVERVVQPDQSAHRQHRRRRPPDAVRHQRRRLRAHGSSVPPLVPGTNYYLGFQNPGASNVTFVFQVAFGLLPPPAAWNTVSNLLLSSTNGVFTFFDDGSLTGGFGPVKFYRLITWPLPPASPTLSFSSVTLTNLGGINDLMFMWSAPTNYQYGIQWTTNLALPFSDWHLIVSPVLTLNGGVYTFVDNGQTGPPVGTKFFRLFEY
jgi:hypothetical protein